MSLRLAYLLAGTLISAGPALAQTGQFDQISPDQDACFNLGDTTKVWQQQVRVGVSGLLDGFQMTLAGPVGARASFRIRRGDGWTTQPAEWAATYEKTTAGDEQTFFYLGTANLYLSQDDTFVIEMRGNGSGMMVKGSYVDPQVGAPAYPEELYLNGPNCYADCGWRVAFETWMLVSGSNYCVHRVNSTGAPANISFTGSTSITLNDLALHAAPVPDKPGMFIFSRSIAQEPFGNGWLCLGNPILRLPMVVAKNGRLDYAVDYTQLPPGASFLPGSSVHFQAWFRDPAAGGAQFSTSNGLMLRFRL